jgi:hypothetical protein
VRDTQDRLLMALILFCLISSKLNLPQFNGHF